MQRSIHLRHGGSSIVLDSTTSGLPAIVLRTTGTVIANPGWQAPMLILERFVLPALRATD